jgi:prepilin-type N-terminal cleavage/methylation domain-containing protein
MFFSKKSKCFTLVELLMVISIIGILSAMIMVGLNSARQKGKDARIESEMDQIRAIAAAHYADYQTYQSSYPISVDNATKNPLYDCNTDPQKNFYTDYANLSSGVVSDIMKYCPGLNYQPTSYQTALYKIIQDAALQTGYTGVTYAPHRGSFGTDASTVGTSYVYWAPLTSNKDDAYCIDGKGNNKVVKGWDTATKKLVPAYPLKDASGNNTGYNGGSMSCDDLL